MNKAIKKVIRFSMVATMSFASLQNGVQANDVGKLFDRYSTSSAGTYDRPDGKTFYGGSFKARIDQNPVEIAGLSMPSVRAGCGGIDIYAGSFSMISKDEVVQTIRGIAQGAPVYAFNLALESLCPSCAAWANKIENTVSEFNRLGRLSCEQAGQALFESSGLGDWARNNAVTEGQAQDAEEGNIDAALGFMSDMAKRPGEWLDEMGVYKPTMEDQISKKGNMLLSNLNGINIYHPYLDSEYSGQPDRKRVFVELMAALTGDVQIWKLKSGAQCEPDEESCVSTEQPGGELTYSELFSAAFDESGNSEDGVKIDFAMCSAANGFTANECMEIVTGDSTSKAGLPYNHLYGLATGISKLIYNETSVESDWGIIQKIAHKKQFDNTPTSKAQLQLMNLSRYNFVGIALRPDNYQRNAVDYVTGEITLQMLKDFHRANIYILTKAKSNALNTDTTADEEMIGRIKSTLTSDYISYKRSLEEELTKGIAILQRGMAVEETRRQVTKQISL